MLPMSVTSPALKSAGASTPLYFSSHSWSSVTAEDASSEAASVGASVIASSDSAGADASSLGSSPVAAGSLPHAARTRSNESAAPNRDQRRDARIRRPPEENEQSPAVAAT